MRILDFLKVGSKTSNPFAAEDYYDRQSLDESDYSPKELATLRDTRELGLGPVHIADGIAIAENGYFSAVLEVGTVNFALATGDEQEGIIGGYHAVLRQLAGSDYQIKVRMVEADLEPLAARVDYALRSYNSPQLHRLALAYKQFLRQELPRRVVLMERHNYVIVSVGSPLLLKMAGVYERETGQPCPILSGLGRQWREKETAEGPVARSRLGLKDKGKKGRGKGVKTRQTEVNPADQRREQLARSRIQEEMEDKMYAEVERTMRRLKHQLSVLVTGLSSNGLALRRLGDWELTALYAEYLRPELAQEVRHSLSTSMRTRLRQGQNGYTGVNTLTDPNGFYNEGARPLSLPQFMGEQSLTVVVSDPPEESRAYEAAVAHTKEALAPLSAAGGSDESPSDDQISTVVDSRPSPSANIVELQPKPFQRTVTAQAHSSRPPVSRVSLSQKVVPPPPVVASRQTGKDRLVEAIPPRVRPGVPLPSFAPLPPATSQTQPARSQPPKLKGGAGSTQPGKEQISD